MTLPENVPAQEVTAPVTPPAPADPPGALPDIPPAAPPAPAAPVASDPLVQLQALTIEQLQSQLGEKDVKIVAIGEEKIRLQNEQALTVGERDRLAGELQQTITDRTAIETELKARETVLTSQLATQTEATRTVSEQKEGIEAQLMVERALRVKSEILLTEYPELAAYAEVIQPNGDPIVIRQACEVIRAANAKVLETQRQVLATGMPASTPTTPQRTEGTVDPSRIQAYLKEGMVMGAEEYERRRKTVLEQLAGVRP